MIFASDLDQTLIYSLRSRGLCATDKLRSVESLDGKEISFMTEESIAKLQEVMKHALFIPVTTRTQQQYERLTIFATGAQPKYAVTSNGGNILINGHPDLEWKQRIVEGIRHSCLPVQDIMAKFHEIAHSDWIVNGRYAEELFYYFVVNRDQLPENELVSFGQWAKTNCWNVSLQGRKVYLVPEVVNKQDAVAYIKKLEGENYIAASGDSLLDYCMLQFADYAIAPRHGELYRSFLEGNLSDNKLNFTQASGILCAEEILDAVIENSGSRIAENTNDSQMYGIRQKLPIL
ncbi:MAG TPA: HAD family hydrolase [Candidatus Deferrimicrobium sp.]|nr:HAD family hydrolase [Candidatus Deferrimicrobium sp.]